MTDTMDEGGTSGPDQGEGEGTPFSDSTVMKPSPSGQRAREIPLPNDVSVLPGERVLRVATFSNGIYWKSAGVFVFAVLLMTRVFNLGFFLMIVAGIMFGIAYMTKHYLVLILTNKRILLRSGLIRMDTVQLPIERLESIEIERTLPGMSLGYGSVVLTGTGSRVMGVPFVDAPHLFRRAADQVVYKYNMKNDGI